MRVFRRKSTSAEVLAASAGDNSWKTAAGRLKGSEQFELLDLVRVARRKIQATFVDQLPPKGTPCPICLTEPDSKHDWFVTSSCGHAICKDCLHAYAAHQVQDPDHRGPLKCSQCPMSLTPKDAIRALAGDETLIALWDVKMLTHNLRSLPSFRICPHCTQGGGGGGRRNDNDDDAAAALKDGPMSALGGGFVTPECLSTINLQREEAAERCLKNAISVRNVMNVASFFVVVSGLGNNQYIRSSCLFFLFFWNIWLFAYQKFAQRARYILLESITVECPCCDKDFVLRAESELRHMDAASNPDEADALTQKWIGSNTRQCPSCSVPISKIDGCNHMCCTHCRAKFCWACMRVGTACAAYNCNNGAPYGNANAFRRRDSPQEQTTLVSRIARMEREGNATSFRTMVLLGYAAAVSLVVEKHETGGVIRMINTLFGCAVFAFAFQDDGIQRMRRLRQLAMRPPPIPPRPVVAAENRMVEEAIRRSLEDM